MLAAFASPITYLLVLLATVSTIGTVTGKRAIAMGPVALTGAAMFILSTLAMNAWRWGDGLDQQLALWRGGLFVDVLLYAVIMTVLFRSLHTSITLVLVALAAGFYYFSSTSADNAQVWEVMQIVPIAVMATICFFLVATSDLVGRLFWGVLMVGEVTAIFQTVDCQLLHDMFGTRAEGSACAQVYGTDLSLLPLGIIFLFWLYVLWRWSTARK